MPQLVAKHVKLALMASALLLMTGSQALAQDLSNFNSDVLAQAEQAYLSGEYDQSIRLADEQLRAPGVSPVERVQAYRLQGLSYTAQGRQRKARKAAQDLVVLYPTYEPSPEDAPEFVTFVQEAQEKHAKGDLKASDGRLTNRLLLGATIGLSILTIVVGIQSAMM